MKKILVVGLVIVILSLLASLAIPALAHGSGDGDTVPTNGEAWEAMHGACENGDWEGMAEAAEEAHGEWGGMGGHMGGGMMGSGMTGSGIMGSGMMSW